MKKESLGLWLLTGDRDELDEVVLQQHGSTAVLVEDERSRGLSCSVDGDRARTRRRGQGRGRRTGSRCLVTTVTSRLPRCCQGGDRGEHAAEGSGDVVVRDRAHRVLGAVVGSFGAAVLCDVRGVARQFDEDMAELLLLGARSSMVALLPAATLLQQRGATRKRTVVRG